MKLLILLYVMYFISKCAAIEIDLGDTELPNNTLKFGYGINYKYVGKVSHSFDRFYVVTKFELPKVEDLKFDDIPYDTECAHLDNPKPGHILSMIKEVKHYCVKIAPHIDYYRKQIAYYKQTATVILTNELALIHTKSSIQGISTHNSFITFQIEYYSTKSKRSCTEREQKL